MRLSRVLALGVIMLPCALARAEGAQGDQASANELPPEEPKAAPPPGIVVPVSIIGGLRISGAVKAGQIAQNSQSNPNDVVGGFDLALELGSTVFDHFYGGLIAGGTFFISPKSTNASVSSVLVGTEFGYLTNPKGFGGFFGVGIAYRATFVTDALGGANKFDGPDVLFTVALHIRPASYIRILPRVDVSLGPTSGGADPHAIFTFGLSAWFNTTIGAKRRSR